MTRWWGGILLFALLISLASVVDVAAQQGVMYACINNSSGEVKLVSPGAACNKNWSLVMWNVAGVQGAVGPPGPVGPAGPPGPVGIPVPAAVTVNCGDPTQTITQALQTVSGGPLTITVNGTCNENVAITRNDVTLQGASAGSGITGPDTTLDTILIDGAQRVILDSLTVSGGYNGVNGTGGAAFTVQRSTIQNASNHGIVVQANSRALIDSNTVTGNTSNGIRVRGSSNATITNTTVQSNKTYGINIVEGSSARIGLTEGGTAAGNLIEDNHADGIEIEWASSALLYGNTIKNNGLSGGYEGISVSWHSTLRLLGGNIITANTGPGIYVKASSFRTGRGDFAITPNNDDISNNTGGGISAEHNSSVDLRDGLTITNNHYDPAYTGFGLYLAQGSQLRIQNTTVSGNAQGGIKLQMASTAVFKGGNNISGNTPYDLQCNGNGADGSYLVGSGGSLPANVAPSCTSF